MIKHITIKDLLANLAEKCHLQWHRNEQGSNNQILPEESPQLTGKKKSTKHTEYKSFVGYLNLIHPNQIQIIGDTELQYFENLRQVSRQDAIHLLFAQKPACIIVSNNNKVPDFLQTECQQQHIPLLKSPLHSNKLNDSLHYYLSNLFADFITLHGVYMEVHAIGLLIVGPSGVGKSELALELINRGHRLIADDAPEFSRIAPDIINGICPPALKDLLEVRGLGIINVRALFGDSAIKANKYLKLIICLEPSKQHFQQIDRLAGSYSTRNILDIEIPETTLPVVPGRNLAVLVECAARNQMLRTSGYNPSEQFIEKQHTLIKKNAKNTPAPSPSQ